MITAGRQALASKSLQKEIQSSFSLVLLTSLKPKCAHNKSQNMYILSASSQSVCLCAGEARLLLGALGVGVV